MGGDGGEAAGLRTLAEGLRFPEGPVFRKGRCSFLTVGESSWSRSRPAA
jgi:hypothetical protein